ncbi:MAG: hypothetical protein IKJ68_10485 [Clostridia bacterium]|nr:hypothetical protein [Clostridia bacterium]
MIYIKESDSYFRYHTNETGKLICTSKDKSECIILHKISKEFDAVISTDEKIHFVLQGLDGELLYLKKEMNTWKKYSILKSRNGLQKISGIKLAVSGDILCAFYIINHLGKNLLVKHVFSVEDLFKEPEVLGVCKANRDFVMCNSTGGQTFVIFTDEDNNLQKIIFNANFDTLKDEKLNFEPDMLMFNAICKDGEFYYVYTVPRKGSIALVFCNENYIDLTKIITFGIARNSTLQILFNGNNLFVQWEENGTIMQAESGDFGKKFSKPKTLGTECHFAKIRHTGTDDLICNKCAVYNMSPYFYRQKVSTQTKIKGAGSSLNNNGYYKNDISSDVSNKQILVRLDELKSDINQMGKNIANMCSFLEDIKIYKNTAHEITPLIPPNQSEHNFKKENVGEIDEDNVKLFESTHIDTVLPENKDYSLEG